MGAVVLTAALAGCDSKTELQTEPQSQEASSAAVDLPVSSGSGCRSTP